MPRVILTRPIQRLQKDNSFTEILRSANIEVIEIPMISIRYPTDTSDLDTALHRLAARDYSNVILTSPTAIEMFDERVTTLELKDRIGFFDGFGTIGNRSAEKLRSFGYKVGLPLPSEQAGAAALLKELRLSSLRDKSILLLQSNIGSPVLERAFEMVGALTDRVTLYETSGPTLADSARLMFELEENTLRSTTIVTFFSPSAVDYFVKTLAQMNVEQLKSLPLLAAIGETTAFEIRIRLRHEPEIIARKADQISLAEDIIHYFSYITK
jgi:uroporphyrinogen-III synthase